MKFEPDDPRLTAYALGETDPAESAEVEAYLQQDARARVTVAEIRAAAGALREMYESETPLGLTEPARAMIITKANEAPARRDATGRRLLLFRSLFALAASAVIGVVIYSNVGSSPRFGTEHLDLAQPSSKATASNLDAVAPASGLADGGLLNNNRERDSLSEYKNRADEAGTRRSGSSEVNKLKEDAEEDVSQIASAGRPAPTSGAGETSKDNRRGGPARSPAAPPAALSGKPGHAGESRNELKDDSKLRDSVSSAPETSQIDDAKRDLKSMEKVDKSASPGNPNISHEDSTANAPEEKKLKSPTGGLFHSDAEERNQSADHDDTEAASAGLPGGRAGSVDRGSWGVGSGGGSSAVAPDETRSILIHELPGRNSANTQIQLRRLIAGRDPALRPEWNVYELLQYFAPPAPAPAPKPGARPELISVSTEIGACPWNVDSSLLFITVTAPPPAPVGAVRLVFIPTLDPETRKAGSEIAQLYQETARAFVSRMAPSSTGFVMGAPPPGTKGATGAIVDSLSLQFRPAGSVLEDLLSIHLAPTPLRELGSRLKSVTEALARTGAASKDLTHVVLLTTPAARIDGLPSLAYQWSQWSSRPQTAVTVVSLGSGSYDALESFATSRGAAYLRITTPEDANRFITDPSREIFSPAIANITVSLEWNPQWMESASPAGAAPPAAQRAATPSAGGSQSRPAAGSPAPAVPATSAPAPIRAGETLYYLLECNIREKPAPWKPEPGFELFANRMPPTVRYARNDGRFQSEWCAVHVESTQPGRSTQSKTVGVEPSTSRKDSPSAAFRYATTLAQIVRAAADPASATPQLYDSAIAAAREVLTPGAATLVDFEQFVARMRSRNGK